MKCDVHRNWLGLQGGCEGIACLRTERMSCGSQLGQRPERHTPDFGAALACIQQRGENLNDTLGLRAQQVPQKLTRLAIVISCHAGCDGPR